MCMRESPWCGLPSDFPPPMPPPCTAFIPDIYLGSLYSGGEQQSPDTSNHRHCCLSSKQMILCKDAGSYPSPCHALSAAWIAAWCDISALTISAANGRSQAVDDRCPCVTHMILLWDMLARFADQSLADRVPRASQFIRSCPASVQGVSNTTTHDGAHCKLLSLLCTVYSSDSLGTFVGHAVEAPTCHQNEVAVSIRITMAAAHPLAFVQVPYLCRTLCITLGKIVLGHILQTWSNWSLCMQPRLHCKMKARHAVWEFCLGLPGQPLHGNEAEDPVVPCSCQGSCNLSGLLGLMLGSELKGVLQDYTGENVNADTFLKVLAGDEVRSRANNP